MSLFSKPTQKLTLVCLIIMTWALTSCMIELDVKSLHASQDQPINDDSEEDNNKDPIQIQPTHFFRSAHDAYKADLNKIFENGITVGRSSLGDLNYANHIITGGTAKALEIGILQGSDKVYVSSQNIDSLSCTSNWHTNGSLCEFDDDTLTKKIVSDSGATWQNFDSKTTIGYLILDLGLVRTINTFQLFQMASDGRTTHYQIFYSDDLTDQGPTESSDSWYELTSGMTTLPDAIIENGFIVNPAYQIAPEPIQARYVKFYLQNTRIYENAHNFIELGAIRIFGPEVIIPEMEP